jgi:hypothetical protein
MERGAAFSWAHLHSKSRGKIIGKREFPQLLAHPGPIPAGDDSQNEVSLERADNLSCTGHQPGIFSIVGESPDTVGFVPLRTRETRGAIDAIPIGRIVAGKIAEAPLDAQSFEHREVGARVRAVGIYDGAVPVK